MNSEIFFVPEMQRQVLKSDHELMAHYIATNLIENQACIALTKFCGMSSIAMDVRRKQTDFISFQE